MSLGSYNLRGHCFKGHWKKRGGGEGGEARETPFCVAKPNHFVCDEYDYYSMTFFSRDEQPWKSNVNSQESSFALKGHLDFKAALTEWPTGFTVVSILLYNFTDCLWLGFLNLKITLLCLFLLWWDTAVVSSLRCN